MLLIARGPRHWQAGKVPTAKHGRERQIRAVKSRFRRRHGAMNTTQESKVASSIFIGRWTPKVLFALEERPYRHGQLRRRLGSVSQRMLTRTLRNLESAGLITRRVTKSKAIAVEYSLTHLGKNHHRSTRRHVPLGKTLPQERERRSATSRNRNRIKAESFVGTYLPARSTASKG
jgi:DNA-binding HxlR family transcriptional regulator